MKRIALLIVASVFLLGGISVESRAADDKIYEKLEVLSKILSYVETNYIEDVKSEELLDNSIKGLLSSLDPHTIYMPPHLFREMQVDTSGEFGGVGIEISVKNRQITIVTPIEDSPADRAGVQPGDIILEINGVSTQGMTLLEAVRQIRGQYGSKVILSLSREGAVEPIEVKLRRGTIKIKSVSSELVEGAYGYVRIKNFQEKTDREVSRHLKRLEKKAGGKLQGVVLDLRNNPGGLLDQAIRVADLFLDSGVIVSTMGKQGAFQEIKTAHKEDTRSKVPIITLVNGGTASASEIVAGALQDHGRSVVLGNRTFGKGSVQTIIDLDDGSGLKLTVAKYYTPKGKSIQAQGIVPDIDISAYPPPDDDSEARVREEDLKRHLEKQKTKKKEKRSLKWGNLNLEDDIQLRRAIEYLKTWEVFRSIVVSQVSGS